MSRWLAFLFVVMMGCGRSAPPSTAAPAPVPASQPLAHLVVHIVDLRSRSGQLLFCVFKSAEGFPGDSKLAVNGQVKPVAGDNVFAVALPPGTYAAAVVHDENADGKLNTNFVGIPLEGYGATNNTKPRRRGVTYSEAQFTLPPSGASLSISLQYDFF